MVSSSAAPVLDLTDQRDGPAPKGGTIGQRLARYMGGRSQNSVERAAPAPSGYVSRLLRDERKNPDPEIVRRICDAVGAPFEWVYYGRGPDPVGAPSGDPYPNRAVAIVLLRGLVSTEAVEALLVVRLPENRLDLYVDEWRDRLRQLDRMRREFAEERRRESDSQLSAVTDDDAPPSPRRS
jgi:transcriptional regulator with XRE-family HTH domain